MSAVTNRFGTMVDGRLKSFTVYRGSWLRYGFGPSLLLSQSGKRCCVGFMAAACGIPDDTLRGVDAVARLEPIVRGVLPLSCVDNDPYFAAYHINDESQLSGPTREKEIVAWFATHGIEVTFVDGVEPP